ncbi:TetR/AcrR family transcriptional regulator [Streptomyces sp. NPDC058855]|uniref:TetR/AcrR family transcriptional regulator n=1 Tax=Streptomyces sp. NPDC058855 TaxID=3346651 RepID=UPI0036942B9F
MAATSGGKTYHHGDLRNALIGAAVDLATEGGPERVVLREAARRVGVSPTAAYRHFAGRGELLRTVRSHARRRLAAAMERTAAREPGADDPVLAAERRLAALCRGYITFALEQPGLYRTAFHTVRPAPGHGSAADPPTEEPECRAFALLGEALEVLGRFRTPSGTASRPAACAAVWSAVHGLSLLLLDGPLRRLPARRRDAVVETTLAMVVSGTRAL